MCKQSSTLQFCVGDVRFEGKEKKNLSEEKCCRLYLLSSSMSDAFPSLLKTDQIGGKEPRHNGGKDHAL